MHEANFLLHAISSMATADSSHLKQVVENIVQKFPGPYSQPVSADDAEEIIWQILNAHLAALPQTAVPRSRQSYAVQECRKQLANNFHVNTRRLITLALLLCPGETHVKQEMMQTLIPPAEEVTVFPMAPAAASLSTLLPDIFPAVKSIICAHAVLSGNSALLPQLQNPERERALTAVFTGMITSAVSTIGNEEISSSSISKIVSSVRSSMMELTIATAEVRSSQTLQRANSEQQMHKSGSYGNVVNRMPSFGASVGSVEQDEPAEIASRGGDSALINLIQKYTKDKAAQQYILSSIASSAKGSRGSTSDFLDSSARLFSASTSQQSNTAAHGTSITGTGPDRYSPQAIAEREKPPDSRRHHYTPRDTLSSTYPEDQPSSTNSGHATNMTRLETHSADTDPSRTGATDSSIRQDNNNASTTKIGVLPAQASPAAGRRSHVDGTRSSASHGSATPSPVLTTQDVSATVLVPSTAGHFGGHFRGRSLGGEAGGDGLATRPSGVMDINTAARDAFRRNSDSPYASRRGRSPAPTMADALGRTSEGLPHAASGVVSLAHAPSVAGSVAMSQGPSGRRDVLQMSAVPRVQEGSPKVHVPYSTSPSDHVHLGDHNRMALAISGTLTASSHPLSNPASSPRSQTAHEAVPGSTHLPPDASAAVSALVATGSDASALQRTLQRQISQGHPWGAAATNPLPGSVSGGDIFSSPAAWDQLSGLDSDTGAVGGTPASHKQPFAAGDGPHGTLPFGTFRRDASGDELNGVSLRPDGQAIHVTSAVDGGQSVSQGARSTRLSHRMRRMASRVPFVRSQIRQQDVPEVMFFSHSVLPTPTDASVFDMTSPRASRTVRLGGHGESSRSAARAETGGGGGTGPLASRGRTLTKSASFAGGKLPVVTSKAMAMAAVNRQLMVTAPHELQGAGFKSMASLSQAGLPQSAASSGLLDRLLQDTQQTAGVQRLGGSVMHSPTARTPADSVAASDASAPAALADLGEAVRMPHSSPGSVRQQQSSVANSITRPSLEAGVAAALRTAAVSQPLPGTADGFGQSSFDNVFSPTPVSPAGSAPLIREGVQSPAPQRRSSQSTCVEGGVSISVNGAISAKSPDATLSDTRSGESPDWPRRSPTFGPHNLSGHLAASMENMAASMIAGSRTGSCGSSPAGARPTRAAASAPPVVARQAQRRAPGSRRRSSTSSPPDVPATPSAANGGDRLGGDTVTSSDRTSSGMQPPSHGSNFSFGRSSQDPSVLLAADAVLWSGSAQQTARSASVDHMKSSKGTQAMSITLARRLDHSLSRSMPARRRSRTLSPPSANAKAAAEPVPGPPSPQRDGIAQQWDRVASGSLPPVLKFTDGPADSPTRSHDGSPESLHVTDTFLLPQPPASGGLSTSVPLSQSSSFFPEASGASFRTAVSASSSYMQESPQAGDASVPASLWGSVGGSSRSGQPLQPRQSLESHGSSVTSAAQPPQMASVYRRMTPPAVNVGPFVVPPGQPVTPQQASPAAQAMRSLSDAMWDDMAAPHSHLPHVAHQTYLASPARSAGTGVLDNSDDAVQTLLQDMQLQVDLAAMATDNELRVQAERHEAAKAEVDPIKAVTSMAAVLGGKFFLLQGVRLILSVCLLVSSVAGFFALLQYAKLNVALSLTIVVGVNVCLAGVLLLIIILKGPAQNGLGDLLRPSGNGGGSSSLQAVLPTFHPVIKDAFQTIVKHSQEAGGAGGAAQGAGEGAGSSARAARGARGPPSASVNRIPQRASITPRGMPLPTIDPHAVQRAASPPDAQAAGRAPLARGSIMGGADRSNGGGGMLSRVVDTGTAIMNRLPPKHRESQVGRIARGLLLELRDHSQMASPAGDGSAVAERLRDESGSSRHARSFTGPAPEIRAMPVYEKQ